MPSPPLVPLPSPTPAERRYAVRLTGSSFPLLGSQILFDAPNAFTEYLALGDRVINHQSSIWIDYPGVFFPVIIAYLSGIDIFHRDAELGVNMVNFDAVEKEAALVPPYPLEEEGEPWAFPHGPFSLRRACEEGKVGSETMAEVFKKTNGPYPLFQFDDLILGVQAQNNKVNMHLTFRHRPTLTFLLSSSLAFHPTSPTSLPIAPYSPLASTSATLQVTSTDPPVLVHTFHQWFLAAHDEGAGLVSPLLETSHAHALRRRDSSPVRQRGEFAVESALGLWKAGNLHFCHVVLAEVAVGWEVFVKGGREFQC